MEMVSITSGIVHFYFPLFVHLNSIIYTETAKANGVNPFEYFKFLMEQLKEYPRNEVPEEDLKKLMPWSETLPDCCKQLKKQS